MSRKPHVSQHRRDLAAGLTVIYAVVMDDRRPRVTTATCESAKEVDMLVDSLIEQGHRVQTIRQGSRAWTPRQWDARDDD